VGAVVRTNKSTLECSTADTTAGTTVAASSHTGSSSFTEAHDTGGRGSGRSGGPLSSSEAEAFFVESLEAWREAMGIARFHLVAHSLSAFFAVAYAEK